MRAIVAVDSLIYFGTKMVELAQSSGAEVYLYMTWSRRWDPYMQNEIRDGYVKLYKETKATIVPVGLAWERANSLRDDIMLYDQDGSHPSPLGTYLSACVFYKVLTGKSPVGLPNRLTSLDQEGEKLYLTIQSPGDAKFCQKVAEEVVEEFKKEYVTGN